MTAKEVQQYLYNFLYEKKIPHKTICAIMGNIQGENGAWDIAGVEVGGYGGFGLCQWTFGRKTQLFNYGTDLKHQCMFLYSEITGKKQDVTGADSQWISNPADSVYPNQSYSYSLSKFLKGDDDVDDLTTAFCYCFERPAYATNHLKDTRIPYAEKFDNDFSYTGNRASAKNYDKNNTKAKDYDKKKAKAKEYDNSAKIEKAVKWAIDIANDDTHGYDQTYRYGPDYDCSSLTISAFEQAGIKLKTAGATSTRDMGNVMLSLGFKIITNGKYKRGDVLLIAGSHVCLYIGDGKIVNASWNEFKGVTGGQTGDQTGTEICVRSYYSDNWVCYRLPHTTYGKNNGNGNDDTKNKDDNNDNAGKQTKTSAGTLWKALKKTSYNRKQLTEQEKEEIKKINLNDNIKMIYKWNKRKDEIGFDFFYKKIVFDNKEYIVVNVRKNGFVIIQHKNGLLKYINPKYIKRVREQE